MLRRGSARSSRIAADKTLKPRVRSCVRMLVLLCAVLFAVSACAKQVAPTEQPAEQLPPPPPPMVEHTVQYSGETLGLIARWYTGKSSNWEAILATNPSLDPRRMNLGTVISIPHELVVNAEPMPREYVRNRSLGSQKKEANTSASSEPTKSDTATSPSEEEQEALTAEERLRRDLEAALAAEVAEDDTQETASGDEVGVPSQETDLGSASEDVDRERLLDELLGE